MLILYPKLFKCYDKFYRKLRKITQRLGDYSIIYPDDPNDFILRYTQNNPVIKIEHCSDWKDRNITHAIIFDDGTEFPVDERYLQERGISIRLINITITRVINIKKESEYQNIKSTSSYEYIGRGSYWGNPYSLYEGGDDREDVIRKFKYDFDFEKFPNKEKSEVYKLAGKKLGCFCKPEACHGDILADFLNSWDDGK